MRWQTYILSELLKGYAKNSQEVTIRCDISPTGFHAVVFTGGVTYAIEPASRSEVNTHMVYYKSDLEVPGFKCGVDDSHKGKGYKPSKAGSTRTPVNLRTYRLAIIADATFRTQFGGGPYNATNVLNSFASGMNMVNEVYERDLGVHLTLVSNVACADAVLTDHTDIDAVHAFIVNSSGLGSGGFEVGHSLLWANTGGVAYLGVVCNNSFKGGGFSGANGSVTQLYVDYMAHELGHQFGADHDANSDPITFSWEQFNGTGGATTGAPNCSSTTQPLFRFRPPVNNNYRIFPQMSDVLAGNNNTPAWEKAALCSPYP
ncbi:MAG: hypothetical protein IPL27_19395 [Lewinellaceae bacterium]|nr:hypothetical protein [Lewinellaceae bacterium]